MGRKLKTAAPLRRVGIEPGAVYRAAELARLLPISEQFVVREARAGRLACSEVGANRMRLFLGSDVLEWLRGWRAAPPPKG